MSLTTIDDNNVKKQHLDFGMVYIHLGTVRIVFRDSSRTEGTKVSLEPWQRHCCNWLALRFPRPESNWKPLARYDLVHPKLPSSATVCPGAHCCHDPGLGYPPGHYPPSHQEPTQMLSGAHPGTWGPYTLLIHIMSCCDESHASRDQPVISVYYCGFRPDFESSNQLVILDSTDHYVIMLSTNYTVLSHNFSLIFEQRIFYISNSKYYRIFLINSESDLVKSVWCYMWSSVTYSSSFMPVLPTT